MIYKIKIKHKTCGKLFFLVVTQFAPKVQLKDLTRIFCLEDFISQTI
jgi:hypothetical protein